MRAFAAFTPLLVLLIVLLVVATPGLAAAQVAGCTDEATVSWDTAADAATVLRAHVALPGCSDGEAVGLQLLVDGEALPREPLVEEVTSERAVFDLTTLGVGIEPVTGVRILLYGGDGPVLVEIEVEQRFFNAPGREQVGLRRSDVLTIPLGGSYVVPPPGPGYDTVPCTSVDVDTDGTLAEGVGSFEATEAGRHLACHRRTGPGAAGQRPAPGGAAVLGETLTPDDVTEAGPGVAVLGVSERAQGGGLARTGQHVLLLVAIAAAAIVGGASAVRRRR